MTNNNNINITLSDLKNMVSSFKNGTITLNFNDFQITADIKVNKLPSSVKEFDEEVTSLSNEKEKLEWKPLDVNNLDDYAKEVYDEITEDMKKPVSRKRTRKASSKKTSKRRNSKKEFPLLDNEGWGFSTVARQRKLHFIIKNNDNHLVTLCKGEDDGLSYYNGEGTEYKVCPKCQKILQRQAKRQQIVREKETPKEQHITLDYLKNHTVMIDNPIPEDYYDVSDDVYIEAVKRAVIVYSKNIITQMRRLGGINRVQVDQTTVHFYTDKKVVKTVVTRNNTGDDAKIDIRRVEIFDRTSPNSFINGYAIKIDYLVENVIKERKNN